jgi:hypothetical protein
MPSNSFIDSGTNSLVLGSSLLQAVLAKFSPAQRQLLATHVGSGPVDTHALGDLATWPTLTFMLQGATDTVSLDVKATDYWQVDAPSVGSAMLSLVEGDDGLAVLGLPIMSGYFTIFDGEADGGKGQVLFASRK